MDNRAIGMFDSGVGGLTVYKEIKKQLPNERVIYFGDTKNFPYGSKSRESIVDLTKRGMELLINKGVKIIIIACGTATSQALEQVREIFKIPIIGIIDPTMDYLTQKYTNNNKKKIGVIATTGTIRSKGWQNCICKKINNVEVKAKACPLLAPMAEEGWTDNEIAKLTIKEYLKDMKDVETLILGCTHYPLFEKIIKKEMKPGVDIINTGDKIAKSLKKYLKENRIESNGNKTDDKIYLSDTECNFINVATKLLNDDKISNKIRKV